MLNLRKIRVSMMIILGVSFAIAFSATDLFAQKGGKGRYRKVSLKKDARQNGYSTTILKGEIYFDAKKVEDPLEKKLLEGLKEVEFRCKQNDPLIRLPISFANGNSLRIKVSCVILIEPQILLLDEPE